MSMCRCGCVGVFVSVWVCMYVCICVLSLFSLSIIVSPILCTTDNTTICLYYQYCRSTIAFQADYFLIRADVTENPPADWSRPVRHCGLAAEMPLEAFNAARRPVAGTASAVAALCINGYIENYEADKVPSSVPRLQARAAAAYSWGGGVLYLL